MSNVVSFATGQEIESEAETDAQSDAERRWNLRCERWYKSRAEGLTATLGVSADEADTLLEDSGTGAALLLIDRAYRRDLQEGRARLVAAALDAIRARA